ncbi:MAG TPA: PaaI family thioesterase [Myxococcota bacterium]|nr:PaaI family thioesterase [Myxococcota bacterium]HRY92668.1 PaaI family thioesterase [Myxococcota bacterium]HSA21561.1 PaaI family thioesterase [Myxococcota bacterium]
MTGVADRRARAEALVRLFAGAPLQRTTGMVLSYDAELRAVFDMPHNPAFEHALGDTHGGVIATLLDNAGWFTAAVKYDTWIATTDLHVRLLEPSRKEALRATGRLVRAGSSQAVCDMEVRSASGRLVATGTAAFTVTSVPCG